jgi:alpha-tubulin suppressor-like RCC1 family protein
VRKRIGWDYLFLIVIGFLGFILEGTLWAAMPQIAAGGSYSLALESDGTLWAWRNNFHGQLGDGTATGRNSPVQIGSDNKWVSIATERSHSLALKSDGTLWAWGYDKYGELGDGTTTNRSSSVQVRLR